MTERRRSSYLSPPDFHRLEWACRTVADAFGHPVYLVGSALTRPDFRDIDLRLILADEAVERLFGADGRWGTEENPTPHGLRLLLDIALSDLIAKTAGLPWPIDFQIQSMTEANVPEHGARNPMGIRHKIRNEPTQRKAEPDLSAWYEAMDDGPVDQVRLGNFLYEHEISRDYADTDAGTLLAHFTITPKPKEADGAEVQR